MMKSHMLIPKRRLTSLSPSQFTIPVCTFLLKREATQPTGRMNVRVKSPWDSGRDLPVKMFGREGARFSPSLLCYVQAAPVWLLQRLDLRNTAEFAVVSTY